MSGGESHVQVGFILLLGHCSSSVSCRQVIPVQAQELADVAAKADEAALAGHNAWMLTSCALVLFMTAPGLAMFYGGLVRSKNVLSIMMQCIFLMGLMTVLWALYGYSLSFGGDNAEELGSTFNPYIGNADYLFMRNVERTWNESTQAPNEPMIGAIPRYTHMLFQGMFFIITPALICGAFAERMKFSAMVVFSILWGTLVYCPLCHWVWGGGILAFGSRLSPSREVPSISPGVPWCISVLAFLP